MTTQAPTATSLVTIPPLFRHAKRADWGLAAVAWDDGRKRAYQFEDGQLRVFKLEYCSLLIPEPHPEAAPAQAVATLIHAAAVDAANASRPLRALNGQVDRFLAAHPDGFANRDWTEQRRGKPGVALKRHRDPALALAAVRLGRPALEGLVGLGDWAGIHGRVVEVLRSTDLVIPRHVELFATARPNSDVSVAIVDLLREGADDTDTLPRLRVELERWSGPAASWTFATALRALVHPRHHVCVRPGAFAAQARILAPALIHTKGPTPLAYAGHRKVAHLIRDELTRRGYPPRDLLDVHDFVRTTLA